MNILVMGAGAWGTALALHFAQTHQVSLWSRRAEHVDEMKREHENAQYLPGFPLDGLNLLHTLEHHSFDLVLLATPVNALRQTAVYLKQAGLSNVPALVACKGFEQGTGLLPHEVLKEVYGSSATKIGILSGPSFAQELAQKLPCAVVLASDNLHWVEALCLELNTPILRLYANQDVVGVAVGGAVKNVLAIATGISDGLGLGLNARAALITRGLAEITRLAVAMGANVTTLMGLSGIGDMILTCTGSLSRNRTVGLLLAEGKTLATILKELGHVAEGVLTVEEVVRQSQSHGVEMPIAQLLYQLIKDHINISQVKEILMERVPKQEM
ncbi:NAD(P)H-dependent glycerol-3-phosphate dehydrogenase [Basilea psittacipulmonis]|uniref:Glycerol-3-phosphate dehydrogenase [NAD(P)+] n=1 Tax=Basilea psittacipulmonis DSM 24701 TaxID=1072685 RepID=A0A077DE70_9BURK|nr:NAD(P)H-dependent glycerol-3-phosphate dehydrogenase [Basilea psittacipulmonis]AIL33140.1 glycerol-3-phosphate dehydrogenase [Basilea psittacipulmonis DSM 24701]